MEGKKSGIDIAAIIGRHIAAQLRQGITLKTGTFRAGFYEKAGVHVLIEDGKCSHCRIKEDGGVDIVFAWDDGRACIKTDRGPPQFKLHYDHPVARALLNALTEAGAKMRHIQGAVLRLNFDWDAETARINEEAARVVADNQKKTRDDRPDSLIYCAG